MCAYGSWKSETKRIYGLSLMDMNTIMLSCFSLYCGRQYLLDITMDWIGAAPMRNSGSVLLGILVMVAMETGLEELEL